MNKYIDIKFHNNILWIGINRSHKKNALTNGMYDALRLALSDARENPEVRAVLLHGTPDVFCAGNDLKGFDNRDLYTPSPGQKIFIGSPGV